MNLAVRTAFGAVGPLFLKSIAQGAATQCYLAAHPDGAAAGGRYYADCNPAQPSRHGQDDAMAERLWVVSAEIVARL
jgi:WW domain-containing oxidoreductase